MSSRYVSERPKGEERSRQRLAEHSSHYVQVSSDGGAPRGDAVAWLGATGELSGHAVAHYGTPYSKQ